MILPKKYGDPLVDNKTVLVALHLRHLWIVRLGTVAAIAEAFDNP